jgi:hypothetical protein
LDPAQIQNQVTFLNQVDVNLVWPEDFID